MEAFTEILKGTKLDLSESRQRVLEFLQNHQLGVLATVDPNGDPSATSVYYGTEDDFEITFMTKKRTKKHDNLQHNNHVVLVVHEAATQTVVQLTGIAEEITDTGRSNEVFRSMLRASLRTSESGIPPISKLHLGEYIAYRIRPRQIRMAMFIRPDAGGYEMYETIDF